MDEIRRLMNTLEGEGGGVDPEGWRQLQAKIEQLIAQYGEARGLIDGYLGLPPMVDEQNKPLAAQVMLDASAAAFLNVVL